MAPIPTAEPTTPEALSETFPETFSATLSTPVGPLSVIATDGVALAAGFCPPEDLVARLTPERQGQVVERSEIDGVTDRLAAYLDGDLAALDAIAVAQPGTELQQQVWDGLRAIPAGQTRTYTQLAAATGRPRAVRSAGTACGRNLVAPIVPCHRALRADGSLGGYYYGLEVKRWLLDHEARHTTA